MSKLKRLLGVLSIVSLFVFSSCVDDEIAPEVTALRQAQVNLLNANTSVEAARAALINAQVQAQTISNTYNSANNAILLQAAQIGLDSATANLAVALAKAEVALEVEAKALAEATVALETYLATAGLIQAGQYLDSWNNIMFGGIVPDFGGTVGVIAIRGEITTLENAIAKAKLYLGGDQDEQVRAAYYKGALDLALTNANNAVTNNEAMIVTRTEQLANNPDPTTALKAALLQLAKDTVTNLNAIKDIEAEITALTAEGTKADSIIKAVRNQAPVAAANHVPNGGNWYSATVNLSAANDKVADATELRGKFTTYGNGLKAVYDKYFPQVQAFETKYAELEAAKKTASDAVPSNATNQLANETAFANYIVAENNFRRKGTANTVSDTNNYVAARRAWDGLTKPQLFFIRTNADGGSILIESRTATAATSSQVGGVDPKIYATKGGVSSISDLRAAATNPDDGGAPVAGTDNVTGTAYPAVDLTEGSLYTLNQGADESLIEARDKADFELRVYHLAVGNVVVEFRNLKTRYEATLSTNAATSGSGLASDASTKYVGFPAADVSSTITFFADYKAELVALTFPSSVAFTFTTAIGVSNSPTLDAITANSARTTNQALARSNTSVTRHTASVAKYAPFVQPYLAAYNAALLVNTEKIDSMKIEPTVRLFAAKDLLKANVAAMKALQLQIDRVNQESGGVVAQNPPTPNFVFGKTIAQLRADWTADRTERIGKREELALAVEVATSDLAEYDISLVIDAQLIATQEAELAGKQARLATLEALAAKYMALINAAIGG